MSVITYRLGPAEHGVFGVSEVEDEAVLLLGLEEDGDPRGGGHLVDGVGQARLQRRVTVKRHAHLDAVSYGAGLQNVKY